MEKDITWSDFFEDNSRYADIINGLGCAGSQLVASEDLSELDTKKRSKTRDLIRKAALGINFAIIGIENQDEIDYELPVRIMNYDALHYKRQVTKISKEVRANSQGLEPGEYLYGFKKESRLYPIVSFVLYAGEQPWRAAESLHEIIDFTDIPETLKNMVSDYKIQVIDIRRLQDTSVFKTDVRHVFDFLRCCNDSNALVQLVSNEEYYQHVNEDAYEVISKYANTKGIVNLNKFKNPNGGIDMCKGLRDLITDSKAEGREAGLIEGHELGLNEGRELGLNEGRELGLNEGHELGLNEGRAEALVHTYQKLKQPKEDAITALVDDYAIPKEDAIKLVEKYWK